MAESILRPNPKYTAYQEEFLEHFVAEAKPGSLHILSSPAGAGKTYVASRAISDMLRTGRMRRLLVLTMAALTPQFDYIFKDIGQPSVVLDGRTQRLIRERVGNAFDDFPPGIFVMSMDLAKRHDVKEMVSSVKWDLVVVDEAHQLRGQRLALIEEIVNKENPPALLLITGVREDNSIPFENRARVFDWFEAFERLRSEKEQKGRGFLTEVVRRYQSNEAEIAIGKQLSALARELGFKTGMNLLSRASSSISSFENSLMQLAENATWLGSHTEIIETLLRDIERLTSDTRLACFIRLIKELEVAGIGHVVVFCEYRDTLEYLSAAIDSCEVPIHHLHDEMDTERRSEILNAFQSEDGVLIATADSLKGISLDFVSSAVHFDLPLSSAGFAVRESRYHRYGRNKSCYVNFLKDDAEAFRLEALLYEKLRGAKPNSDLTAGNSIELFEAIVGHP